MNTSSSEEYRYEFKYLSKEELDELRGKHPLDTLRFFKFFAAFISKSLYDEVISSIQNEEKRIRDLLKEIEDLVEKLKDLNEGRKQIRSLLQRSYYIGIEELLLEEYEKQLLEEVKKVKSVLYGAKEAVEKTRNIISNYVRQREIDLLKEIDQGLKYVFSPLQQNLPSLHVERLQQLGLFGGCIEIENVKDEIEKEVERSYRSLIDDIKRKIEEIEKLEEELRK